MSERKITIKIDRLGRPTVEAHNFNGVGCTDATRAIESALAGSGQEPARVYKPEWANDAEQEQGVHQQAW